MPPKHQSQQTRKMKLSTATEILRQAGIENARHEARLLFSEIAKIPSTELYGRDAEADLPSLDQAIQRRAKREPLQYIIGRADFYRETYRVTQDCLIPRPDTEILVDEVIRLLPKGAHFIDLCTGSGCIALSVLNNTDSTTAKAVDISDAALRIAKENAESLSLTERTEFIRHDVLSSAIDGKFSAIVSNPPYVTTDAYTKLMPEIYFEPDIAFLGGDDGLVFYKKILELYKDSLEDGGFFAFEIGYDQADALIDLAKNNSLKAEIIKDLSGNDRVAVLRK